MKKIFENFNEYKIASLYSGHLYFWLKNNPTMQPSKVIVKDWIKSLKKYKMFDDKQLKDLEAEAIAQIEIDSGPRLKQTIKDKIIKLIKKENIR